MLYVVATPIGNLGDISARAAEALRTVDTVLAEDTRVTRKLLAHLGAHPVLDRFDEHTAYQKTPAIVERVLSGEDIALVSDAGTPGISDPGQKLIDAVLDATQPRESSDNRANADGEADTVPQNLVTIIPGPSAVVAALSASGLPNESFYFGGFLPRKAKALKDMLEPLAPLETTLVFFESPRRIVKSLEMLAEVLGARDAAVARELTKLHEEVVRAPLPQLAKQFGARDSIKGEIVLVIAPPTKAKVTRVHVDKYRATSQTEGTS